MQDQPGRHDFDQALKRLFTRAPNGFLALVAPDFTYIAERKPELPAVVRQADLVWEVERVGGQRGILHIELQTAVDPAIGERVAEYAIRLWRRDHLPVRSLVVYLREATNLPVSPFAIEWDHEDSLRYNYATVRLWEIPQAQVLDTENYFLWPLVSMMAGVTAETTREVAERIAVTPLPHAERSELTGLLAVLASRRLPFDVVLAVMRRNRMLEDLLRESSLAEYLREEGKLEGRQEGMAEVARGALETRFGALGADVLAALRSADEATLRSLVPYLLTDTLDQVRARLGLA